jgi:hypothetical protein
VPIFDRVRRGERLKIRADQWNALVDQAERAQRSGLQFGDADQLASVRAPNVVTIQNTTDALLPRFGVLRISGAVHNPTNHPERVEEFVARLALRGGTPGAGDLAIVVALEPIAAGAFGRAAASGVFACRIDVCSMSHRFARAKANNLTVLESAPEGPVQILWAPGTGQWAVAAM